MTFLLFDRFDKIADLEQQSITHDFYSMLMKLRDAARNSDEAWATYPDFVDYAKICFWAIRKQEYSFIAESFARLEIGQPLSVLDVGCGVVPMCNWISARGHNVFAVDPRREDIEFLVKNNINVFYGSNVKYMTARSEHLPFGDESFDVVTCTSVLEHIIPGNDRISMYEIARVLKPGGHLLITFDVSPTPTEEMGNPEKSGVRGYTLPFTVEAANRLLGKLGNVFEVSPLDLPSQLNTLTWEQVYQFWRAAYAHDERHDPVRHYLAIGNVLKRKLQITLLTSEEVSTAYLEGQAALLHRLLFFEHHANQRAQLISELEKALRQKDADRDRRRKWRIPFWPWR